MNQFADFGFAARRIVREIGMGATVAEWKELGKLQGAEWESKEE